MPCDGERKKCFHYLPILDSLQALFRDPGIEYYLETRPFDASKLQDFQDGHVFRNKDFFQRNPDALQILLYQDSFEISNPLGSAKKPHKILGVYY